MSFSLEGHSFWIPTQIYDNIISHPLVNQGETSTPTPTPVTDNPNPEDKYMVSNIELTDNLIAVLDKNYSKSEG